MADNAYHTGVVGLQHNNEVSLRTVVLRTIDPDEKEVVFYTDNRSAKMEDIASNPNLSWLFYDSKEKVQLKLSGEAIVHHDNPTAQHHWEKVHAAGKSSYMAIPAPSTAVDHPVDGLEHLTDNSTADEGYANFAAIVTRVNFIEWLSLKDTGHRRAQFRLIDNSWKGQWLIP
jgi:pyridoxamine 5'-phosphate oxidase